MTEKQRNDKKARKEGRRNRQVDRRMQEKK